MSRTPRFLQGYIDQKLSNCPCDLLVVTVGIRNEKAPADAGALRKLDRDRRARTRLLHVVRNRLERRLQLRAETVHNGDDRNGDASRDEAIFDGGRA